MTSERELPCNCRQRRNLWHALAEHWFEDLPEGEELGPVVRGLVATAGTATFAVVYTLLLKDVLTPFDAPVLYFLMCLGMSGSLGFLLAWKRKRSGPVRLYLSGVVLPSFVLLVARSATFLGGLP